MTISVTAQIQQTDAYYRSQLYKCEPFVRIWLRLYPKIYKAHEHDGLQMSLILKSWVRAQYVNLTSRLRKKRELEGISCTAQPGLAQFGPTWTGLEV